MRKIRATETSNWRSRKSSNIGAVHFWALTAYFNPVGYRSRRDNYRLFRQRLGVPLITVELAHGGAFELGPGDADVLIQIRDGDMLWQKERLLNIALASLPPACRFVAWLDCDILFADRGWSEQAVRVLEREPIAQPFDRLVHLRRGELPENALPPEAHSLRTSFASRWRERSLPEDVFRRPEGTYECRTTCGMGWIARREVLDRHGLYDTMVLGLGDKHIAAAATGQSDDAIECTEMSARHGDHYGSWADGLWRDIRGNVGCVPGQLYHLWHGELANRRYIQRYRGFSAFDFDPDLDLVTNEAGAWRWARPRHELHGHVAAYFRERREDESGPAHQPAVSARVAGAG